MHRLVILEHLYTGDYLYLIYEVNFSFKWLTNILMTTFKDEKEKEREVEKELEI